MSTGEYRSDGAQRLVSKIVVFGIGQIAQVAHFYLQHDSPHEVVAFTVDRAYMTRTEFAGLPVVPFEDIEALYPPAYFKMSVPISYRKVNKARADKYGEAKAKGYELISYVSSKANVWPGLIVGDNCFIFEGNVIQPFVTIGDDVIIWSGSRICHHSTIRDHCFVASDVVVSGSVTIEPYCFLGAGAAIRDGITIARGCVIGAGALITKDTQQGGVYRGTEARLLSRSSDQLPDI